MKKQILLITLLMALLAPMAMKGQQTLQVADQGGTTSNSYIPFQGLYADDNYQHTQTIYPSSLLTTMQGGTITKLTYYLKTAITTNLTSTFEVRLGTTTQTSFSSGTVNYISMTGSANYTGTIDVTNSSKEVTITLSTPYTYNSGNLVVDVRLTNHTTGYKTTDFLGETGSTYYSVYSKSTSSQPPFTQGTAASFMPKTTFTYLTNDPYIGLNPASTTIITGSTQTLAATYGNVTNPTITYTSSNTSVATVTGSGTTATVTGVAPGSATITATMNGSYTATCAITVEDPSYCTPGTGGYDNSGISNVTFGTNGVVVNNTVGGIAYGNYSNLVGAVDAGTTCQVDITYKTGYTYGTIIWVDWDHSYTFEGTEAVYAGQSTNSNPTTLNATFPVPATTQAGDYRMRIIGSDMALDSYTGSLSAAANADPCGSYNFSTCHDYTLRVNAAPSCLAPNNLTATNITTTTATLSWSGEADDFYVRYRTAAYEGNEPILFEDFEDGLPTGWISIDSDGDGNSWEVSTDVGNFTCHSGSVCLISASYLNGSALNPDNWLITSQIELQGIMKVWLKGQDTSDNSEHFAIYLSTSGTNVSDFTTVLVPESVTTGDYQEFTANLNAYTGQQGYIAIRHFNCTDQFWLDVDDFGIYPSQEAGQWLPDNSGEYSNTNSLDIDHLTPETEYEWQVMADCGEDGVSNWSDIATFTTLSTCIAPNSLSAEVTGNTAALSWTGYPDTYDIQYREVDPTEPATIILTTTDIWNDGSGYQMLLDADATAYSDNPDISDYSIFEYLIPTNATYDPNTTGFVINNSVTIQIPAGTYDWFITNPSPDYSNVYIAANNGNVGGRQDNYVFEAGKTYEFVPSIYGQNDGIDVTITADWTLLKGVTNPYTLENLASATTYEFQVQGADCDNWSASATFTTPEFYTKEIIGYGDVNNTGGYYLIASPLASSVSPDEVTNMTSNKYDLYSFNQFGATNEQGGINEWENYKKNSFDLEPGKGYLYAHDTDVILTFTGQPVSGDRYTVTLTNNTNNGPRGKWNLVGNSFTVPANIGATAYYKMKSDGSDVESVTGGTIDAMEGIFVLYDENATTVTFAKGAAQNNGKMLTLNVTQDRSNIDRAIVRFDEGNQLPKFQIFENTKVYIPQGTEEFAVVNAEAQGEMPVSFKADSNGTYTLSVNAENVEFSYLHLIDNMTGAEVDLLETPSYSFNATTSDYSSRFKLVFAQGNNSNSDDFAFISNGNIIVNGEGMLQVIDMTGRIISTSQINGVSSLNLNAAAGVYVLQLTNGENVKTQKIVVK